MHLRSSGGDDALNMALGSDLRPSGVLAVAALIASAAWSMHALGSGHIPPLSLPPRDFESFKACHTYLQQVHADDMKGTADGDIPLANGGTRRKSVQTDGVLTTGVDTARYEATVGEETRSIESLSGGTYTCVLTNFSYVHSVRVCTGARLSDVEDRGYALPDCRPAPDK